MIAPHALEARRKRITTRHEIGMRRRTTLRLDASQGLLMPLTQTFEPSLEPLDHELQLNRPPTMLRDLGGRRERIQGDLANTGKIVARLREREPPRR